ncbi:MAG TPA: rhomboid family intramembrane serine protease [Verrucomicrobiae bacterium]|nr:rhomboid family intramembrane serine protease [Verrucomicrobiae bacterium]
MIGHLETESGARTFSDYLYAEGIGNELEQERNGKWALWIQDEDHIVAAKELLEQYHAHPADPKYKEAQRIAREKKEREEQENEAARKRFFDSRRIFPAGIAGIGALTVVLVALCVAVGVFSSLGTNTAFIQPLSIAEYFIDGQYAVRRGFLPEVQRGEIWRLVTPIFIHFGAIHLFLNMWWLLDLGTMVERRQGSWRLALLVLVIAILSNVAEYYMGKPNFGGMSGVVYGLIGYIWMRGKHDPGSGLYLHSTAVTMAVIWYFLCLAGLAGNIANTVHTVGFAVGLAWGYLSAVVALRR